jgi:hypothetical protein
LTVGIDKIKKIQQIGKVTNIRKNILLKISDWNFSLLVFDWPAKVSGLYAKITDIEVYYQLIDLVMG